MVQLLQDLADEFADFAQGMVRGNPLLRMNVRKHPALILRSSAHLQSSRRIRGGLNHHSFALARFFSKLLEEFRRTNAGLRIPHHLGMLAGLHRKAGKVMSGLRLIAEAAAIADANQESWCKVEL